jgi:glycosyltransferase involved in cell wall biosynthesis
VTVRPPPLRLLHVIPRFIGAGPERSLLAFAAEERRAGIANRHTVAVLDPPIALPLLLAARKLGIAVVSRPGRDALAGLIEAADIVVVHFWNHPALADLLRQLEFPPARVIVWSRVLGLHAPQVLPLDIAGFGDRLVVTAQRSLEGAGVRGAAARGIPVRHIPGIADTTRLDGFVARPHDGVVVGYVGVVADTKMHPRFAEISAAVRADVRFTVCGGGGGEAALAARFAALGMSGRVVMRGPVEAIRAELEGFDVFGYPLAENTYATSEKALQEAMWVGLPPVVFPHGGVRDLVVDGETGLVATSEEGYAEAVDRLAGDSALRRRLGENARSHARAAFDPVRWAQELDGLLRETMDEPLRSRPVLPGAGDGAAANFVRMLGDQAGAFAEALDGKADGGDTTAAEARIAAASALVARGEGGVVHYRNAYPDDPHLRRWADLVTDRNG